MKQRRRDEWLKDIDARQRNTVFPDTVQNEARFWRNLMEGKQRLTLVQWVGISFFALAAAAVFSLVTFGTNNPLSADFSLIRLAGAAFNWIVAFGILGAFLLIFRLSQRTNRK